MIESIALLLLTFFTIYYIYFITRIRVGILSLRTAKPTGIFPVITVVVAARDEENAIGQCLQSLIQQTYSANKYEIIVVDDGSTDMTATIVKSFSEKYSNIHLLSLGIGTKRETGRKPLAIAEGIAKAAGEIILTTDADCIVPPKWIEIMTNHFEENVVFVAGPVAEQSSAYFLSGLERLEFLGLITTAAGLIGSGRPIICNGANLAYRKSAFIAVNGFDGNVSSNDDESLMNKMFHRNIGKVVFAPEAEAIVMTHSSNTLMSFLRQRVRWANKRGHYEDPSILVSLVSLYFFFLSFLFTAILIPSEPRLLLPLVIAFVGKVLVDYFTLRSGAKLFRQHISIFQFLIAELSHVPYIVIAAGIGQISAMQWKGRIIQR